MALKRLRSLLALSSALLVATPLLADDAGWVTASDAPAIGHQPVTPALHIPEPSLPDAIELTSVLQPTADDEVDIDLAPQLPGPDSQPTQQYIRPSYTIPSAQGKATTSDIEARFFQGVRFNYTWLAPSGSQGLGLSDLDLRATVALPFPNTSSPLLISPGFAINYLEGPITPDLPPRVYDSYIRFRWLHRINERWGLGITAIPGAYGDYEKATDDTFRCPGYVGLAYEWSDDTQIKLGAVFYDRIDTGVLPIGGVVWTPNDDTRLDLVFPRPRFSRRFYTQRAHACQSCLENWWYVGMEIYHGGAWDIRRETGENDLVSYRDLKVLLGVRRENKHGLDYTGEIGYVFDRRLSYRSDDPDRFYPTETLMLRFGVSM